MYFSLSFASGWPSFTYKFADSLLFICISLFLQPLTSPSFTYKLLDFLFFICISLFLQPLTGFHLHINFLILYFLYVFLSFVSLWLTSGVFATTLQLRFSRTLLRNFPQSHFTSSNVRGVPLEMSLIAVFPSISS